MLPQVIQPLLYDIVFKVISTQSGLICFLSLQSHKWDYDTFKFIVFFLNSIISCGEYCPSLIISCTKSLLKSISACYPMGFFSSGGLKVRPEGSSTSHFLLLDSLHEFQFWGTKERLFSINITWIVHAKLPIRKHKLTTLPQSLFYFCYQVQGSKWKIASTCLACKYCRLVSCQLDTR